MTVWRFLVGFPKRETKRFWIFSALIWGGIVCLVYAESFRQHYHVLIGWYWIGVGLQLLTGILGVIFTRADKSKRHNLR